jgi:hypothetical protein
MCSISTRSRITKCTYASRHWCHQRLSDVASTPRQCALYIQSSIANRWITNLPLAATMRAHLILHTRPILRGITTSVIYFIADASKLGLPCFVLSRHGILSPISGGTGAMVSVIRTRLAMNHICRKKDSNNRTKCKKKHTTARIRW